MADYCLPFYFVIQRVLIMLKIGIITIGDEIAIGQIVNTNAQWIANECTKLGAYVTQHIVVRDDQEQLISELQKLSNFNDVIITSGGLGPTHDDITKNALTEYFDDHLIFDEATFQNILELFARSNRQVSERNKSQALIPSKSKALRNLLGTAPGLYFVENNKHYFSLPGVPSEMMFILNDSVLPIISNLMTEGKHDVTLYRTIHTTGIFESVLADLIGEPSRFLGECTLAFLPSYYGVRLRIGVSGKNYEESIKELDRVQDIILGKVSKYVISTDDKPINKMIGEYLKSNQATVAVAESCTAGMLGGVITEVPGSSQYFIGGIISYSNEAKMSILNVKKDTIEKYGAVSKETALEMAENVRKLFNTDYGISITGIAGPDGGTESKPVGTVWIGIADRNNVEAYHYIFSKDRAVNRNRSVGTALSLLMNKLKSVK